MFDAPHRALAKSTLRIARCNQLFPGGIDYPVVQWSPPVCLMACQGPNLTHVAFWLIPSPKGYHVVKAI